MKRIDKNSKIFISKEFEKDKYKFHLILMNLDSPELEMYSDEDNYLICRGSKEWPIWIWSKDNIDNDKLNEIEEALTLYLNDKDKYKFICKKELYDLLVKNDYKYLNKDYYFEMGFLTCKKTIKPRECYCTFLKGTMEDLPTLEKYFYDDHKEMNGVDSISIEEAREKAINYIKSGNFYVLKDNNKIVSMAGYKLVDNQARINSVYTPIEERRKGYAANIIYLITNKIFDLGLVPLLYTDYNYIPSNNAYKSVGYEDEGILINFYCSLKN